MNKRKTILSGHFVCCLLLAIGLSGSAQTFATIAHRLLALEQAYEPINSVSFKQHNHVLNDVLLAATKRIRLSQSASSLNREQVQNLFLQIDSLLAERGFFTCIKVEFLSQCLKKIPVSHLDCHLQPSTAYRRQQLALKDSVYKMDCDIGSMLYMSIAQALHLPVFMVEVPKHNFVRWQFADGSSMNWDVNEAQSFSNDLYRKGLTSASYIAFDSIVEKQFNYLSNLDTTQVLGYYAYILGRNYKRERKYAAAVYYYKFSISKLPTHPLPKMCLAYLLTFHQSPKNKTELELANQLALEAARCCPHENVYIETLACSYARLGRYDEALQTLQQSAKAKPELLQAFKNRKTGLEVYKPVD